MRNALGLFRKGPVATAEPWTDLPPAGSTGKATDVIRETSPDVAPTNHAATPKRRITDPLLSRLATEAASLGYEIVDVAGFLDQVEERAKTQILVLRQARQGADQVLHANQAISDGVAAVSEKTAATLEIVDASVDFVRTSGKRSTSVATWVSQLAQQMQSVVQSLATVERDTARISGIARQVNILAINAKIEASRAGEAGRGFATIANAINELSQNTADAAESIAGSITSLTERIATLSSEASGIQSDASSVITDTSQTDESLSQIADQVRSVHSRAQEICEQAEKVRAATQRFQPAFEQISNDIEITTRGVVDVHKRISALIDSSESMVQVSVNLGGAVSDQVFIDRVQQDAARLGNLLEDAVDQGRITMDALFSTSLTPVMGSDPQQMLAPFTAVTDALFPPVQEAAAGIEPSVVFCAAVNRLGYLPTHNRKFSHPQGDDPTWNAANCRNRRIFDDRVGLKAGRNTQPFLLQVYRRDMGGGVFRMMKDVSAPILVRGQHWGGLRLAYAFKKG